MGDEPKSAYDLAMEKLRKQDKERGEKGPRELSEGQKEEIAETRSFYKAKIAEREILYKSDLAKAMGDPDKSREVEESYRTDRARLESERDGKISKIKDEA